MIKSSFLTKTGAVLVAGICVIALSATSPIEEGTTAGLRIVDYLWSGTKWYPYPEEQEIVNVSYRIDSDFGSSYVNQIRDASVLWSAPSSIFQIHAPTSTTYGITFNPGNWISDVVLQYGQPPNCNGFAACTSRGVRSGTDEIVEADIFFDQSLYITGYWTNSCISNKVHFLATALHEFGHLSGFEHGNGVPDSPLRSDTLPQGECVFDLSPEDVDGIRDIYGTGGGTGGGGGGGCGGCRMLDGMRGLEQQIPDGVIPLIYDTDYQNLGGVWETLSPSEAGALADMLLLELDVDFPHFHVPSELGSHRLVV